MSLPVGTAYQIIGANSGATALTNLTLAGTANQVAVGTAGSTITLSTPQNIGTGSSPTFAGLTLSSPLTAANGGTGLTGGAWSTYTPTVSSQSGTITTSSASGRYQQIGKTVHFSIKVTITTAGTGSGNLVVSLPVNTQDALTNQICSGFEGSVIGHMLYGAISGNQFTARDYANVSVIQNGAICYFTGAYEAA